MPHIAITMIPGRDDKTKQELALKTQAFFTKELGIDSQFISVSIQDVPPEDWQNSMAAFPEEILFVKPGI